MVSWLLLSLCSAAFLGFYDIAKKSSVRENAVPPVLLLSCLCSAVIWTPWVVVSLVNPQFERNEFLFVDPLPWPSHVYLFAKSALVGASWTFAFFALKRLPITVATPIRATSPLWTILIACVFMSERPSWLQSLGIVVIISSFFAFTLVGRLDGIQFHRDRGVAMMIVATLLAACSAIYDKYLLQNLNFRPATVQAWFSIYLVPVMLPFAGYWVWRQRNQTPLQWRWTIPMIAMCLIVADYLYFSALRVDGAMISLVSPIRRVSVVIAFIGGSQFFGEVNLIPKAICTAVMLFGVFLISQG